MYLTFKCWKDCNRIYILRERRDEQNVGEHVTLIPLEPTHTHTFTQQERRIYSCLPLNTYSRYVADLNLHVRLLQMLRDTQHTYVRVHHVPTFVRSKTARLELYIGLHYLSLYLDV